MYDDHNSLEGIYYYESSSGMEVIIMEFWRKLLQILDTSMDTPGLLGWFHILWLALVVISTVVLCFLYKKEKLKNVRAVVLVTAVIVSVLEIYKQINYSFSYENGITFDFQWYAFPWQFCSMPMYVGLLAGLTKKGKVHDAACAFLATFSLFAGLCVMIYPGNVFIETIGVNIQTMVCHGSMIVIAIYLLYTGHVKVEHKTILKAVPVFAIGLTLAVIMNELAYYTGLLETESFNMFYVSRHCESSLPVFPLVQAVVPYPWSLIIYIAGFSIAAYLLLLIAIGIKRAGRKKKLEVTV